MILEGLIIKLQQQASAMEGKIQRGMLGWKGQTYTADKSESTIGILKSKGIGERRKTQKILEQVQAIQTKKNI